MTSAPATREAPAEANYDEATVAPYALPDPLVGLDGTRVDSPECWRDVRRGEILRLFEDRVFGSSPGRPPSVRATVVAEHSGVLGGLATRREIVLEVAPGAPPLNLLLYLPEGRSAKAPLVLGPNFLGNHTVSHDPGVRLPGIGFAERIDGALRAGGPLEAQRGVQADRWQVERILRRGFAVATFHYGDLFPDRADGARLSVQPFLTGEGEHGWGALATWAWSMSRALDWLEQAPEIDAGRVVLFGHSRHGKAALWAGALDRRFAIVIANNSGKGGASLMRRDFGETLRHLVTRFPHWFAAAYRDYADHEERLPVDQHMLLSLIAPRPLYIASAVDDLWADPKGEFLGALGADPVYRLLGASGLPAAGQPPPESPVAGTIGYHLRRGGHGVTAYDWDRFLDFADFHFRG